MTPTTGVPEPSAPERIYLQVPDDCDGYADAAKGEVTWCADAINDGDVEYIRADAAESLIRERVASELEEEAARQRSFWGEGMTKRTGSAAAWPYSRAAAFVRKGGSR